MRFYSLLFVCHVFFSISLLAQKSPITSSIKVKVDGLKPKDTLFLAGYNGPKQYFKDTAIISSTGIATFESNPQYPGGIYSVVMPDKRTYYEFIMAEPSFYMETKYGDFDVLKDNVKVKDSPENQIFFDYQHFISQKLKQSKPYRDVLSDSLAPETKKNEAKEQLKKVDQEVIEYKKNLFTQKPDAFITKVLQISQEPEIPNEWPKKDNGQPDSSFPRRYYLQHYWDNVDLKDDRLLRTPVLHGKMEKYITQIIVQHPDSINKAADELLNKARGSKDIFRHIVQFITNHYEKSQIMGMDAVFVHMGENYYMSGEAYWADSTMISKISERVRKTKPTLIGKKTPNIILQDTTEKNWVNLYKDIKAKYTILYFWDSGCGHCKKETPRLKELYKKYKSFGIEVLAVGTEFETKEWKKYIRDNKLDWINVSDNPEINKNAYNYLNITTIESLNFRDTYDIYSTPRVFLLDEDKKILAKRIGVEQLEELLVNMLKKDMGEKEYSKKIQEIEKNMKPNE